MKKVLKWIGIAFVGLIVLGAIINATKSPEQKAAEAADREQKQAEQVEEQAKQAEKKREQALQDGIPKCDSVVANDTLKKAFDQSQFARTLNISAIEISAIRESAFESKSNARTCFGTVTMNNTKKVDVNFKIVGRTNGQFMLTFEVVN